MNGTTTNRLPDTGETALAELRRLMDTSELDYIDDGVVTEPDPYIPGVWKVETPGWVAVVYLAGYDDRTETDFEMEITDARKERDDG